MREYIRFSKHWLSVLVQEDFLGLCLVFFSGLSLVPQMLSSKKIDGMYLLAFLFLFIYIFMRLRSVTYLALLPKNQSVEK